MYKGFFELRERPFELTSDPRFLYRTARHREALANLEYGVSQGRPVTLLTGEPGTGNSTLLRAAMCSDACRHVRWVYLANSALTRDELVTQPDAHDWLPRGRVPTSAWTSATTA